MPFNTGTHFHIHLYSWMVKFIPRGVTPNHLTMCNIVVQMSYLLKYCITGQHDPLWLLFLIMVVNRLVDNVDGIYARTSGQTSRLGEYLDHGFDAFYDSVWWFYVLDRVELLHRFYYAFLFIYPITMTTHYLNTLTIKNSENKARHLESSKSKMSLKDSFNVESPFFIFCDEDVFFLGTLCVVLPQSISFYIACLGIPVIAISGIVEFFECDRRVQNLLVPYLFFLWQFVYLNTTGDFSGTASLFSWFVGNACICQSLCMEAWHSRRLSSHKMFSSSIWWILVVCALSNSVLSVFLPSAILLFVLQNWSVLPYFGLLASSKPRSQPKK
eukprot:TRINITY_DN2796_c0_g1_i5.p1 TRINITY_DN2796_c0_g1~~TRINITY_DN2796_c0_g1_i5.p1  ORF type:complete len:328 (-),score=24.74 TRINITY_DN2796_c0_g1_i5:40-1023(-)